MASPNVRRFLIPALLLTLAGAAFVVHRFVDPQHSVVEYERREIAAAFTAPVLRASPHIQTTEQISLAQFKGKPVLLHFWASWCTICRQEKPDFDRFWSQQNDEKLVVLGLASFDTKNDMNVSGLISNPGFLTALDESGDIANSYKVPALPYSILIDADGYIVRRFKGAMKPYDFGAVERYLAEKAPISQAPAAPQTVQ